MERRKLVCKTNPSKGEGMTTEDVYYCVVCGRGIERDEYGLFVHDDVPHPPDMAFDDEEKPQ